MPIITLLALTTFIAFASYYINKIQEDDMKNAMQSVFYMVLYVILFMIIIFTN